MTRFVGITVLGDFILSEGVQSVLENLVAVGAAAVAVGLLAGAWWPPALIAPAGYAAAVMISSIVVGRQPATVVRLTVVYPPMHLSWGLGFLWGLLGGSERAGPSGSDVQASYCLLYTSPSPRD